MFRIVAILIFSPTIAAAEWIPKVTLFTYEAAFAACQAEPDTQNLAVRCDNLMRQSFVLKRAVVAATQACLGENLNACALPFEDQGLTAIAARIAAGTGCENTDLADWQEFIPFPENHCAPLIADILADEGVVPLNTDVPCDSDGSACVALAQQQRVLWAKAVIELENGPLQDPTVHETIRAINRDCRQYDISNQTDNIRVGFEKAALCEADGMARLWQDLTANP